MLRSLMEQKRALCTYGADYDLPVMLTASQWKLVENLISLLAPFEELTNQISSSTATAADVIPAIRALSRLLRKQTDTDQGVKTTKATLLQALERRFSDIESEPLYTIATVLDPRYKDRYFSDEFKPQIRRLLSHILSPTATAGPEEHSGEAKRSEPPEKVPQVSSLHAMYDELLDEGGQHDRDDILNLSSAQMNLYLSEAVIPQNKKPLTFWQDNKSRFPSLAQAAQAYLCAPCTSVDSERLFSAAGNIIDEKRNKLTAKNAEMLIFLKVNLPVMLLEKESKEKKKTLSEL